MTVEAAVRGSPPDCGCGVSLQEGPFPWFSWGTRRAQSWLARSQEAPVSIPAAPARPIPQGPPFSTQCHPGVPAVSIGQRGSLLPPAPWISLPPPGSPARWQVGTEQAPREATVRLGGTTHSPGPVGARAGAARVGRTGCTEPAAPGDPLGWGEESKASHTQMGLG